MSKTRRVFAIADFQDEFPIATRTERRQWVKGFIRLGLDVQRFSYRNVMEQLSLLKSRSLAQRFFKERADAALAAQIRAYHPDLVVLLAMKNLDARTVEQIRQAAPGAAVIGREDDGYPEANRARTEIARRLDMVFISNAGSWMEYYKQQGVPWLVFLPPPCDPDIHCPYPANPKYAADIFFAGKASHHGGNLDPDRPELISRLRKMDGVRVYGANGEPNIEGIDIFIAMSSAKISLSINAVNTVRLYHSDRFINSIACGAFTVAKTVPDSQLLFEDEKHVRYFENCEQFFELAKYYLSRPDERQRIALAGMERAHAEFNCTKMAGYVIDLVERGTYSPSWACQMK